MTWIRMILRMLNFGKSLIGLILMMKVMTNSTRMHLVKEKYTISDDDDVPMEEDEDAKNNGLSRKRARKLNRPSVAQLKQVVDRPEIVEWTDVAAQDPTLLIHLRGYRNMIAVPAHWGQKRDYLASKRGVAKQAYELPSFIRDTGIQEMR